MSDVSFMVVPADACVQEVIDFRNANRALARDRSYFEWRYERRPCRQKATIVWGVDERGRKVAAASLIPHDFYVLDGVYPVGLLGDISVAPECRGRGVATRMLQYLRQDPAFGLLRACLVLPNDEVTHSLERAGWRTATSIARFVKIVDVGPRLGDRPGGRWMQVKIASAINLLMKFASLDGWYSYRNSPYGAEEIGEFDRAFDELWEEVPKHGRILSLRDRSYLRWRYHEHPVVHYRVFGLRHEQRLRGYIVFHVVDNVAVIDDFLVAEAAAAPWLLKELLTHVRREKLAMDIYLRYNADSFLGMPWARFGFVRRSDSQRVMASALQMDQCFSLPSDGGDWFITTGDKDV